MRKFDYFQPTDIHFGCERVEEVGKVVSRYGNRCLLVTVPVFDAIEDMVKKVKYNLKKAGIEYVHYDGAIPNPTTEAVAAGTKIAKNFGADIVLGLGGGSSIDTAKAVAVEATHDGSCWDYLFFRETQPTQKTLPIIAVTTTAGTGSHVTKVSVISNSTEKRKSAIVNPNLYPKACIVDPLLTLTVPEHITASTGFDVFTHAFEAFIHKNTSPYVELVAKESIRLLSKYLYIAVCDGSNLEARTAMSWADTLAGLSITNAGTTLPHGIGQAISGYYPHISHGESLAVIYPEFMNFTYESSCSKFAILAKILDSNLEGIDNKVAAKESCSLITDFLKKISMYTSLKDLKVSENKLEIIADFSMELPDYLYNPKVATRDDVLEILKSAYNR